METEISPELHERRWDLFNLHRYDYSLGLSLEDYSARAVSQILKIMYKVKILI
jgi:hypothetical protein